MPRLRTQAAGVEQLGRAARHGGRRIDDRHAAPGRSPADRSDQEGIVRTPQHDLVGAARQHSGHRRRHGAIRLGRLFEVVLHQLDEAPPRLGDDGHVAAVTRRRAVEQVAFETPFGRQYPHHAAARILAGGFHGRLHTHDRQRRIVRPQEIDRGGRRRIAGHDDQFAPLLHEPRDGCIRKRTHLLARARAVGAVLAVAQIEQRLLRQQTPHLAPDGQPAQSRIVDSYRSVIHSLRDNV